MIAEFLWDHFSTDAELICEIVEETSWIVGIEYTV